MEHRSHCGPQGLWWVPLQIGSQNDVVFLTFNLKCRVFEWQVCELHSNYSSWFRSKGHSKKDWTSIEHGSTQNESENDNYKLYLLHIPNTICSKKWWRGKHLCLLCLSPHCCYVLCVYVGKLEWLLHCTFLCRRSFFPRVRLNKQLAKVHLASWRESEHGSAVDTELGLNTASKSSLKTGNTARRWFTAAWTGTMTSEMRQGRQGWKRKKQQKLGSQQLVKNGL